MHRPQDASIGHSSLRCCVLAGLILTGATSRIRADVPPWADRNLSVTSGLVLWLDASRQQEARAAEGLAPLQDRNPSGVWFDSSGHRHHVVQRSRAAQPTFHTQNGKSIFRFDGKDDHYELNGLGRSVAGFTVFIVAAPGANPGGFSSLVAANATGRNDYLTGFTIDLGPWASQNFESLNPEGIGFVGARNVMSSSHPMGHFHVIEVRASDGPSGVELTVDGSAQGHRERSSEALRLDELTVGARFYSNDSEPPSARGFFDGEIAEILLYDRALKPAESAAVRQYLHAKIPGLEQSVARTRTGEKLLVTVKAPPPVQFLVPGFEVRQLPLKLSNINNLRYRPDGKLLALAYNGDVYVLSDTDGDGQEDHAEIFWDNQGRIRAPIGMALTPRGYRFGNGMFVASKGKCSLIVDIDGDDRADREIIIAQGWTEIGHGVDALGVALGADGSVYFGIGTRDFTNPYLLDASGRPHYNVKGEGATIERVAPDFSSRQVIATGIRFPVSLAFNRLGDLFATDQEGATWLPNGNPFDELLHIQPGRHYGFPPRHSRYLPVVIDEPSVFDYTPQHQSTCGLNFNVPINGGPTFGPREWGDDALVCGYSRGKLYRTKLAKTAEGYVAKTTLLACTSMLLVDACVGPDGALTLAAHSGGPDWGSGPNGQGTLYKVRYVDHSLPQPVLAWPGGPTETFVAFDRPVSPDQWAALIKKAEITYGKYVAAGDRFETLRPGYAAVAAQLAAPRFDLKVHSSGVTPDRRTLVLTVGPQTSAVAYAVSLSDSGDLRANEHGLSQHPGIDLAYDLTGLHAAWVSDDRTERWDGWLPHMDLSVARTLTAGSAEHDRLWGLLAKPGHLRLAARFDVSQMLRPAVQPGIQVNDQLPPEEVVLVFAAGGPFRVRVLNEDKKVVEAGANRSVVVTRPPNSPRWMPIEIELTTGPEPVQLGLSWHTNEDPRPRAWPPTRCFVPWARVDSESSPTTIHTPEELAGGSWSKGRKLFLSETARCSQCHTVRGEGGKIGPDLSNLSQRDVTSVLRDIRDPSFAIHPDYISYNLALTNGQVLTGTVRTVGKHLLVGDTQGRVSQIARTDVEEMKPLAVSTMPKGLTETLDAAALKDLLTFLLAPEFAPAPVHRPEVPPARTRGEIETALKAGPPATPGGRPLRIVLVDGPKDHGIDEHDYPLWRERWSKLLSMAEGVTVTTASGWPSDEDFAKADVLVWYSANPGWNAERGPALDALLERGGGMVYLHYAVNGRGAVEAFASHIGLAWRDGASRFRHGPLTLSLPKGNPNPITAGLDGVKFVDESYWALVGDPARVDVLATCDEEGQPRPLLWTREQGKGRVFCSIPGHYTWTFDDPLFRLLILRGIAWAAHEPVGRFNELATPGARIRND